MSPAALNTLSLHDALPIYQLTGQRSQAVRQPLHLLGAALCAEMVGRPGCHIGRAEPQRDDRRHRDSGEMQCADEDADRSEEHTSELQSHSDLVCRLLLEKK